MAKILALLFASSLGVYAAVPGDSIGAAFDRLYNFDFAGAHRALDTHLAAKPKEPLGFAVRSSVLLFEELQRLQILESEFFADDRKLTDKRKLEPDGERRRQLFDAIALAQKYGGEILVREPGHADALFAVSLSYGVTADYQVLIEKKFFAWLTPAKESHAYALRLIGGHPGYADAHVSTGLAEYLIASLPFFVRWFVKFDQVEGTKAAAIRKLQQAADGGRYLRPFAKLLLAVAYLRDKKPAQTRTYLAELARDYPENLLIRRELEKVSAKIRKLE